MSVSSDVATTPGWYGKLPSLGDFASRRLEADFIEPWDLWLGEALQSFRDGFGESWLDAYLDTPPWRFLLAPGVLRGADPACVFAGVLVPSVDRVGRHFPLTLVASLRRVPDAPAEFDALLAWLHRLEDTALDALQGHWSIDELEDALADLQPPSGDAGNGFEDRLGAMRHSVATAVECRGGFVDIAGVNNRAELAAIFSGPPLPPAPRVAPRGIGWWIADIPGRAQLLVSDGLPGHADFSRMFAGGQGASASPAARPMPALAAVDDDPLATRPQALDAPLGFAASHRPEEGDLLSLFGREPVVPAPADPHAEAPRDDILAMFQAEGGMADVEGHAPADPLANSGHGAFEGGIDDVLPPLPADEAKDDILSMFSADSASVHDPFGAVAPAAAIEPAWDDDDPLGLKAATPLDATHAGATATPATPAAAGPTGEPDILDMFGVVPGKPAADESK